MEADRLIAVAEDAGRLIPDMVDRKSMGLFYEYHARLLEMKSGSRNTAVRLFEKSIVTYPSLENPSICRLKNLVKEMALESPVVLLNFNVDSCPLSSET